MKTILKLGQVLPAIKDANMRDAIHRVIKEHESENGELIEISHNFYAISKKTNDVYYFGEEVDIYRDGKIVSHDGAWFSGRDGAIFGLIMPGTPLLAASVNAPRRRSDTRTGSGHRVRGHCRKEGSLRSSMRSKGAQARVPLGASPGRPYSDSPRTTASDGVRYSVPAVRTSIWILQDISR